jgi:hypothetical protein
VNAARSAAVPLSGGAGSLGCFDDRGTFLCAFGFTTSNLFLYERISHGDT